MRKNIRVPQSAPAWDQGWLDVNKVASVEVTSEDQNFPIECALLGDHARGWRAAESEPDDTPSLRHLGIDRRTAGL